jgi:hypothetical protein
MAAPIYSYRPEIKIEILDNDITINLGDKGACTIRKNLYQPAGEFQLVFPDIPVQGWFGDASNSTLARESLYGLVNPMDRIVIWVRRWRDGTQSIEPWIPVLTGFVRSVGRDEMVGPDGRPQRQVVIAGQDCGAVFLMEQAGVFISYGNETLGSPISDPKLIPFAWLREYGLTSTLQKIEDFIWEVATKTTESIMKVADFEFQKKFYVQKGTIQPHSAFTQEGAIWEMLYRYADGPWNEFFVRENRNMLDEQGNGKTGVDYHAKEMVDPELVFRPTPWLDWEENPLPDVNMDSVTMWNVKLAHVVALRAHRDDSELVNHTWVQTPLAMAAAYTQAVKGHRGLVNADTREKFGDRMQVEATRLWPSDLSHAPINLPMDEQKQADEKQWDWATERRNWMIQAQTSIHEFERGSMTLKGYPMMRVGDYFRLHRGDVKWMGYITNVVHDFQPYRRYLTTLDYIRGNQAKVRRTLDNPWDQERKPAG